MNEHHSPVSLSTPPASLPGMIINQVDDIPANLNRHEFFHFRGVHVQICTFVPIQQCSS